MASNLSDAASNERMPQSKRTAAHPFDIRTADVIFRTADGVDFYLYKAVLTLASPFFADMFSLGDCQASQNNPTSNGPIVISEDSDTFDKLLRFCYPVEHPTITELRQTELVLRAAIKYQISKATTVLRSSLLELISTHPSEVFALACRLQLEDVARAAAIGVTQTSYVRLKSGLKRSGREDQLVEKTRSMYATYKPDTMGDIPAGILFRLHLYRTKNILPTQFILPPESSVHKRGHRDERDEAEPWLDLRGADVDVTLRSLDGVDFPFNRLLLRLAGADRMLEASYIEQGATADDNNVSEVTRMGLSSEVLGDLLRLCYPASHHELNDTYRLWQLSQAAIKYDMAPIVETLRKQASRLIPNHPLAICLASMYNGWKAETQAAARVLAGIRTIEYDYEPILEDIPASLYHSLLTYHSDCIRCLFTVIQKRIPYAGFWEAYWDDNRNFSSTSIPLPLVEQGLRSQLTTSALFGLMESAASLNNAIEKELEKITQLKYAEEPQTENATDESDGETSA